MNALQTSIQPPDPQNQKPKRQSQPKRRPQSPPHPHKQVVVEVTTKLVVNVFLSSVVLATMAQLFNYYNSQQAKLGEIKTEVKQAEKRVNRLQSDFNRNFDPQQSRSIMQEQSPQMDPSQKQILWLDQNHSDEDQGKK
jgi:hypothetical protein